MSNPSYLNPVLNRSTIRDEVKNVLFDFYRGTSYVSACIALVNRDIAFRCLKHGFRLRAIAQYGFESNRSNNETTCPRTRPTRAIPNW